MKFEEALLLAEEGLGGTIKTSDGKKWYNVTKARRRENENLDREREIIFASKKHPKLKKLMLDSITNRRKKLARGNENEYTVGGNIIRRNNYKVDTFVANRNTNDPMKWAEQRKEEQEIADRLNKQKSSKSYNPR